MADKSAYRVNHSGLFKLKFIVLQFVKEFLF